jgi:hypothetical protein
LSQINTKNVGKLKVLCTYDRRISPGGAATEHVPE